MKIRVGEENEFDNGNMRALVILKQDKVVCFYHNGEYHAMEAVCPHSGGPLHLSQVELVDIEDMNNSGCTSQVEALVCPWHSYKFTLDKGKSVDDDIFSTNVYKVINIDETLYIDYPKDTEIESISFFKMKPRAKEEIKPITKIQQPIQFDSSGFSLVDWAVLILNTPDPTRKVQLTFECNRKWNAGEIENIGHSLNIPERPARDPSLKFVDRFETKKIGKGGSLQSRIVILHALANIEQWAIDLAWDIIARYSTTMIETPDGEMICINSQKAFFDDFVRVAKEEATHFTYLVERLRALGAEFGDLKVHDGLWDSAIVHMVHEARGLDVNPATIAKFKKSGDHESTEKLLLIHRDEITHVAAGQRWFSFICELQGIDKYKKFHDIVGNLFFGPLRPPFNEEDRQEAGLDPKYYLPLASINK